jgi:hypothetical protein
MDGINYFTPWSAPVTLDVVAPFDLSTLIFSDAIGPRFTISGTVREAAAAGSRVTVALARGRTGGRYRTIARPRISSARSFRFSFTQRRYGTYRLRIRFAGNGSVAPGTATRLLQVRRILR